MLEHRLDQAGQRPDLHLQEMEGDNRQVDRPHRHAGQLHRLRRRAQRCEVGDLRHGGLRRPWRPGADPDLPPDADRAPRLLRRREPRGGRDLERPHQLELRLEVGGLRGDQHRDARPGLPDQDLPLRDRPLPRPRHHRHPGQAGQSLAGQAGGRHRHRQGPGDQ